MAEHPRIVAALGHTDATYEEVEAAVEAGLSHGVHTFNAMTGLHHRKPGVVGAMLSDDRLSREIIADGIHVHPRHSDSGPHETRRKSDSDYRRDVRYRYG